MADREEQLLPKAPEYNTSAYQESHDGLYQQPSQDIVMLRESAPVNQPDKKPKPSVSDEQLKQTLKQLKVLIATRKQMITTKRAQLKDLSSKVQQQLQKTLLSTTTKRHPISNVSQYFSKEDQTSNEQLRELKGEIRKVRAEADKVKKELEKVRNQREYKMIGVPVERFVEVRNNAMSRNQEIARLNNEKELVGRELAMVTGEVDKLHLDESEELTQKHIEIKNKLVSEVKAERLKGNEIERQDRQAMEKIKFLFEITSQHRFQAKRRSTLEVDKGQRTRFSRDMSELAHEITKRLQQKFHTQISIKKQFQSLRSQTQRLQKDNWNMVSKLREYDAFLLNHYNSIKNQKRKKRESRDSSRDMFQKERVNSKTVLVKDEEEDPVKEEEETIVEKVEQEKIVEVGEFDGGGVVVSDGVEGGVIGGITLYYMGGVLSGIQAIYTTNQGQQPGYTITAIPKNKQMEYKNFQITEKIQEICLGHYPNSSKIGYLSLKSNNTLFEWGATQNMKLQKQKLPSQYTELSLVACLKQNQDAQTPNQWHISGISFRVTAITQKIKKKIRTVRTRKVKRPEPESTPPLY